MDWFAPTDWAALSQRDADLGSTSPLPIADNMVFQIGKTGVGYLLHGDAFGNIGGQAFAGRDGDGVKRIVHQLKGAAGCYGFPTISAAARAVEDALAESRDAAGVREEVMALCALCVRANGK